MPTRRQSFKKKAKVHFICILAPHLNAPLGECMHPLEGELRIRYENRPVKVLPPAYIPLGQRPEDIGHIAKKYLINLVFVFWGVFVFSAHNCVGNAVFPARSLLCHPPLYYHSDLIDFAIERAFDRHAVSSAAEERLDLSRAVDDSMRSVLIANIWKES